MGNRSSFAFLLLPLLCLLPSFTFAQAVDDVVTRETDTGFEVEVKFFVPLRYQSHWPQTAGDSLDIQLRTESFNNPELVEQLDVRSNLSWDKRSGIPLRELIFDGEVVESPSVILRFTHSVEFSVRNSADLRSLIISVVTPDARQKKDPAPEQVTFTGSENLITQLKQSYPDLGPLLERANQAMLDKDYSRAVQVFTRIRDENGGDVRKHVQELLGLARESNGQLAHAKAEYQQYLEENPTGEDAQRVEQRLAALLTAAERPKERLRGGRRQRAADGESWDTQFYGSISQIYFRDETTPEEEDALLLRSDVLSDLDFVARARKGDFDVRTQFIGSYREDLIAEDSDGGEFQPNIWTIEGRHTGAGLYARLGRQSRTTGGVLGRFDGLHTAYELGSAFTVNAVFGYPVDTQDRTKINTDQEFYGASFDIGTVWDGWDFSAFYISQENADIQDREAVGGEMRYYDATKSLFTLVDYDIEYDELNIFLLISSWTVWEGTTLNLTLDQRKSPILTTTNAIQGQGVFELEELFDRFSEEELRQLAIDRTSESQSATLGVTQQFGQNWQGVAEVTVSEFDETIASGGVEAIPGTGKEYFYSAQLIGNSLVFDSDIAILGLRYSDTFNADTYSLTGNWRINSKNGFRLNPRLRVDYREEKDSDDSRWLARPFLRMDYRFKKWMKFELDIGYEWLEETFAGEEQNTTGYFFSIGYRAQF
ncbi:MAG: tetratricopeptide repeat protein [Halioglobus sp.]